VYIDPLLRLATTCLHDRPHLHLGNARVDQPEAAPTEAHHRVRLRKGFHQFQQPFLFGEFLGIVAGAAQSGDFFHEFQTGGEELVHGRVDQPDDHRQAIHDLQDTLEVAALIGQESVQILRPVGVGACHDHPHNHRTADGVEEHVLGTAQADAFGAEGTGHLGVARVVRVGIHTQATDLVRPRQEPLQLLFPGEIHVHHLNGPRKDLSRGAIDGEDVPFLDHAIRDDELGVRFADRDRLGAHHTRQVVATRHHGRM